jgi:hypothetical protein
MQIFRVLSVIAVSTAAFACGPSDSSRPVPADDLALAEVAETPPSSEIAQTQISVGDLTFDVRTAGPAD